MKNPVLQSIVLALVATCIWPAFAQPIQHDAEHYVLLHQYADQWAAEDNDIDQKLSEIRERNGGKPPNIVYILIDDMGFGEFGMPELNKIRVRHTGQPLEKIERDTDRNYFLSAEEARDYRIVDKVITKPEATSKPAPVPVG